MRIMKVYETTRYTHIETGISYRIYDLCVVKIQDIIENIIYLCVCSIYRILTMMVMLYTCYTLKTFLDLAAAAAAAYLVQCIQIKMFYMELRFVIRSYTQVIFAY